MSLLLSLLIASLGGLLFIFSLRYSGGDNAQVAMSLLEDRSLDQEDNVSLFDEVEVDDTTQRKKAWLVGAAIAGCARLSLFSFSLVGIFISILVGAFAGELFFSRRRENRAMLRLRKMDFYLPTVMERIVMGVGSGLDVIPALREAARGGHDPISQLFQWIVALSERGTPVEEAFEMASRQRVTSSVKHACIHLSLAYRQGGEIVRPLKELSDATQVAYQEGIEEQIAKLPVKAVLPIVLTFTGLIVCFLTVPLMQVGSITKKVVDVSGQ